MKGRKESIAIIIPSLTGGGAERTASNLSIELSRVYDVHIIVFDTREVTYPYGGMLHSLNTPASDDVIKKSVNFIRKIRMVKRIKKKYGIVASLSFMEGANLLNCLSKTNDRIIVSVRTNMTMRLNIQGGNVNRYKQIQTIINKKSDMIVAISEGVRQDLIQNYGAKPEKVKTIYNPCDSELILKRSRERIEDVEMMGNNSISAVGRLVTPKGQWHLIRAFRKVKDEIPDASLYIIGEGELREMFERIAAELDLKNSVHMPGFVNNPHPYIAKSSVFVFPSQWEGLGNVLLEAMCCGTPCIASDCRSGPREILSGTTDVREKLDVYEMADYGILVSNCGPENKDSLMPLTREEEQLADAIIRILSDKELRIHYKEQSLNRINDFAPDIIAKQWRDVIGR